jgi:peptidoglycan/xylan/chitin deacetylase (PgdA/CDA1 family)
MLSNRVRVHRWEPERVCPDKSIEGRGSMQQGRPMRRLVSIVVLMLALGGPRPLVVAAQQAPPASFVPVEATVVGTPGVNIRSCARVECGVEAVAKLGESIMVTGNTVGGFYPVDWGGLTGFAYELYLDLPDRAAPEFKLGRPGCKRVALIFNIGVRYEPQLAILDWLKAEQIDATVFPMGFWAVEQPAALARIAALGFPIGNHGDQRLELTGRPDAEVVADIQRADDAIEAAIGRPPERLFTPYAGAIDDRVRGLIGGTGYLPVGWTAPADDWDFDATADQVYRNVMERVQDGALIEFHLDAPASATSTAVAMPKIVEALRQQGYSFTTVSELTIPCPSGVDAS